MMSFFDIWPLWVWLTSTFGLIGVVILIIAFPTLASAILGFVLKRLGQAIRTPLGAGIIAGAVMFGIGHYEGSWNAIEECNARVEQMRKDDAAAAKQRDADVAKKSEQFNSTANAWIDAAALKREETAHVPPKPAAPVAPADCRKLGRDGHQWLRDIAPD